MVVGSWSIPLVYREAHPRQWIYEHAHAALGRYLQEPSRPDEVVYAWDIGYIGYLTKIEILDFAGIVSPQVMKTPAGASIKCWRRAFRICLAPRRGC